ncbi:MAG TPA: hypothetical protein VK177_09315 [Flavobacteriales bacterium]|nr:hypothetical protein [Flavobacteriales bacterium]
MAGSRNIFLNPFIAQKPLLFLVDSIQLFLFFYILNAYGIEQNKGLTQIGYFVGSAFLVSHLVNKSYIPWVFVLTSIALVFYAFNWFAGGLFLVLFIGAFGILTFNYNIYLRIIFFILFLGVLAFLRLGYIYMPRLYMITPFIGAIFMFRGIMYLYYVKNHKIKGDFKHRLAYFLMFPNLVFVLYPIIDFKEFLNCYLVKPFDDTRQKALRYMLRAIVHLLLYRLLFTFFYIDAAQVSDLPSLIHFMVSAYLLILRLSGILHLCMAFVCLFGYDLSPVFNYFFLGSSFTDLWRRINTYWRNFMQKVFFYPLWFRIRKPLGNAALPVATAVMFFCTWFFHNYQFFWARGGFPLAANDALFWFILGTCITINVAYLDYKARKKIGGSITIARKYARQSFFIIFCFFFMCFLWSLWGSASLGEWKNTMSFATVFTGQEMLTVIAGLIGIYLLVFAGHYVYHQPKVKALFAMDYGSTRLLTIPAFVLLASFPLVQQNTSWNNTLTSTLLNKEVPGAEQGKKERGYYKQLIDGNSTTGAWEVTLLQPLPPGDIRLAAESTEDIYLRKLIPNVSIDWNGKKFSTNSFGLRDKEYVRIKPAGMHRIVLLGGSYEMGSGVADNEVFEAIAEEQLKNTEIMNFGCGGYHIIQQAKLMEEKVMQFEPDEVILVSHSRDKERFVGFMAELIRSAVSVEYEFLKNIKQKSGVKQYMGQQEIEKRLMPYVDEIFAWCYKRIAICASKNKVQLTWLFLPATNDFKFGKERDDLKNLARQLGFRILDLSTVWSDAGITQKNRSKIAVSVDDPHPNALGHSIIASALVKAIMSK